MKNLESAKGVDVVWDTYITSSIKESVREKRGKGIRRKMAGQNKVPSNWSDFLRDSTNKQELLTSFPKGFNEWLPRWQKDIYHIRHYRDQLRYLPLHAALWT